MGATQSRAESEAASNGPADGSPTRPRGCGAPPAPQTIAETGLRPSLVADLIVRHLYLAGAMLGRELFDAIGLEPCAIEPLLQTAIQDGELEARPRGRADVGDFAFTLRENGRLRARQSFRACRYVGPAPVTPAEFAARMPSQSLHAAAMQPPGLESFLDDPQLADRLGPALFDADSLLLSGESGNGKTRLATTLATALAQQAGPVWLPTAIAVDDQIVTVFDGTLHKAVASPASALPIDRRWRCVLRPVVLLTALDRAAAHPQRTAPAIVKAAGGVCIVDDIGPADHGWLDRIVRHDVGLAPARTIDDLPRAAMLLLTGSTDAAAQLDEAVLRRIRHKVPLPGPSKAAFDALLAAECERRNVPIASGATASLWEQFFDDPSMRRPRRSDASELIEIATAICRFRKQRPAIESDVLLDAARQYLPAA